MKSLTTASFLLIMETSNGCGKNQCDVDQDPELQEIFDAVKDEAIKKALMELSVRFRKKQIEDNESFEQIFNLYNDINDRLREQERYSSKDSLVIKNPPFKLRDSENLFMNFFHEYLKLDLKNVKAFHVLPTQRNLPGNLMPSVIVTFIYFQEKRLHMGKENFSSQILEKKFTRKTLSSTSKSVYMGDCQPSKT